MPVGDVEAEGLLAPVGRKVDRSPVDGAEEGGVVRDKGGVKAVRLDVVDELEGRPARQAKRVRGARLGAHRREVVLRALDLDLHVAAVLGVELEDLEKVVAREDVAPILGLEVDGLGAESRPKVGVVRRLIRLDLGPPWGPEVLCLCLGSQAGNAPDQGQREEDRADEDGPRAARHEKAPLLEPRRDFVLDNGPAPRDRVPFASFRHPCHALHGRNLARRRRVGLRIPWCGGPLWDVRDL
mmetsp:Transcript_23342/g.59017  ORF Transcript_23342/g.59017 Transcript_23342/m.59017 type:complete len:240 (-) Transcript_23342:9-728(-)